MPSTTTFDPASEHKRQVLRQKISQHNEQITALIAKLNTFAHTSSLPDEILLRIFFHFRDAHLPVWGSTPLPSTQPPFYRFIIVSHVCRHWRKAALNTPLLWDRIAILNNLDCLQAMFERSRSAPLSIEAPPGRLSIGAFGTPRKALALLSKELHRVQSLSLDIPEKLFEEYSALLSSPTPSLRSMYIRCFLSNHAHASLFQANSSLRLLTRFYVSGLPAKMLHNLDFPSITEFSLYLPDRMGPWDGGGSEDLIKLLSKVPALQSLTLVNAAQGKQDGIQKVALPNLQSLRIVDSIRHTIWLLTCLQIPSSTKIQTQSKHGREGHELRKLGSAIASIYQGGDLRCYTVRFDPSISFLVIEGYNTNCPAPSCMSDFFSSAMPPLLRISISPFAAQGGIHNLLCPLPNVQTAVLCIDGSIFHESLAFEVSEFGEIASVFPSLTTVRLEKWPLDSITRLVSRACGAEGQKEHFLRPQTLVLQSPIMDASKGTKDDNPTERMVEGLVQTLKERAARNASIPELLLEGCSDLLIQRLSQKDILSRVHTVHL